MFAKQGLTALEHLKRCQSFYVNLIPHRYSGTYDPRDPVETHELVLRPLLRNAEECWAYEIEPGSEAEASAGDILERTKGKCRIRLDGEPIIGHEYFWNASGGSRGTIVITVRTAEFAAEEIFPHCVRPQVLSNFTVANTPSAVRYARAQIASGERIAFLFPRNNGFEWMHVVATVPLIEQLYEVAQVLCIKGRGAAP